MATTVLARSPLTLTTPQDKQEFYNLVLKKLEDEIYNRNPEKDLQPIDLLDRFNSQAVTTSEAAWPTLAIYKQELETKKKNNEWFSKEEAVHFEKLQSIKFDATTNIQDISEGNKYKLAWHETLKHPYIKKSKRSEIYKTTERVKQEFDYLYGMLQTFSYDSQEQVTHFKTVLFNSLQDDIYKEIWETVATQIINVGYNIFKSLNTIYTAGITNKSTLILAKIIHNDNGNLSKNKWRNRAKQQKIRFGEMYINIWFPAKSNALIKAQIIEEKCGQIYLTEYGKQIIEIFENNLSPKNLEELQTALNSAFSATKQQTLDEHKRILEELRILVTNIGSPNTKTDLSTTNTDSFPKKAAKLIENSNSFVHLFIYEETANPVTMSNPWLMFRQSGRKEGTRNPWAFHEASTKCYGFEGKEAKKFDRAFRSRIDNLMRGEQLDNIAILAKREKPILINKKEFKYFEIHSSYHPIWFIPSKGTKNENYQEVARCLGAVFFIEIEPLTNQEYFLRLENHPKRFWFLETKANPEITLANKHNEEISVTQLLKQTQQALTFLSSEQRLQIVKEEITKIIKMEIEEQITIVLEKQSPEKRQEVAQEGISKLPKETLTQMIATTINKTLESLLPLPFTPKQNTEKEATQTKNSSLLAIPITSKEALLTLSLEQFKEYIISINSKEESYKLANAFELIKDLDKLAQKQVREAYKDVPMPAEGTISLKTTTKSYTSKKTNEKKFYTSRQFQFSSGQILSIKENLGTDSKD